MHGLADGREVWFDPHQRSGKLENPHLLITGQTGGGKRQGAKSLLAGLQETGVMPLVIDFKGDWSAPDAFGIDWARDCGIPVYASSSSSTHSPRRATSSGRRTPRTTGTTWPSYCSGSGTWAISRPIG